MTKPQIKKFARYVARIVDASINASMTFGNDDCDDADDFACAVEIIERATDQRTTPDEQTQIYNLIFTNHIRNVPRDK